MLRIWESKAKVYYFLEGGQWRDKKEIRWSVLSIFHKISYNSSIHTQYCPNTSVLVYFIFINSCSFKWNNRKKKQNHCKLDIYECNNFCQHYSKLNLEDYCRWIIRSQRLVTKKNSNMVVLDKNLMLLSRLDKNFPKILIARTRRPPFSSMLIIVWTQSYRIAFPAFLFDSVFDAT
jgi:hypothetical protein